MKVIIVSEAELTITFTFIDPRAGNKTMVGHILRLNSPLIVQSIINKAPFTVRSRGNLGKPKSYLMAIIEISRGPEKQAYKDVKPGDIVYCPRQDALFIFYDAEYPKIPYPMYFIGNITKGLYILPTMRNGTMMRINVGAQK